MNLSNSRTRKPQVFPIVSIDVEEDDWGVYHSDGESLTNLDSLPRLQELFDRHRVKPTYLIDYPVACDHFHGAFFQEVLRTGKAEIGVHLHPWNTPPFASEEVNSEYHSRLHNLPPDIQKKKLTALTEAIEKHMGKRPTSFRAGRFSFNSHTIEILDELGYRVDSSFAPFMHWEGNYQKERPLWYPYRVPSNHRVETSAQNPGLWEIPATIGFNRSPFELCSSLYEHLGKGLLRVFRLRGVLKHLHLLKKIGLSPEWSNHKDMLELSRVFVRKGVPILNLFFHSTSLLPGLSPFVRSEEDLEKFYENLENYFGRLNTAYDVTAIRLSECPPIVQKLTGKIKD